MKLDSMKMNWYVAYTCPQAERKAKAKLDGLQVKTFLPMQKVVRQWSDRKKTLEVPLFPNYIFIYTNSFERYNIIKMPELVCYVTFEGQVAVVPDTTMEVMEKLLSGNVEVSNENFAKVGSKIKITSGKFAGVEGTLLRQNGRTRVVVRIEALRRSISIDISASCVEAVC